MRQQRSPFKFAATSLAALLSTTAAAQQADRLLSPVEVQATAEAEVYQAVTASSATKIQAPLRDVPQTVNVVTEKLLEDQAAHSLQDALRNVPGVSYHIGDGQRDQFYIRGFDAIGDLFIDGLRDDALYYRDLANIERVEVVKGPAAVLYGRGSSGGIINRITKKPSAVPVREAELTAGSFGQKRLAVDVGDTLGEAAQFRIVGAVEEADSFRDQGLLKRHTIAPSLSLAISPDTKLLFQVEQLNDRRITDMGIPAYGDKPAKVSRKTYYGTNDADRDDFSESDVTTGRIRLDHRINDSLSLSNHFGTYRYRLNRQNTFGQTVNNNTGIVSLFHGATDRDDQGWFNQLELTQRLATGGVGHQLLYGLEVGKQDKDLQSYNWSLRPTTSVLNPVQPSISAFGKAVLATNNRTSLEVESVYVQDLLTLSQRWKALLGLRHDTFRQSVNERMANAVDRERTDREWSPRAGIVFQPNGWQSYYLSYSSSFQPSGEVLAFTTAQSELAPEETSNVEVGVKLDLFDGKAAATAAIFELERTNIKSTDPVTKRIIPIGEQRTRGIELTLAGEVAPGWQLSAGYAYLDALITKSVGLSNGVLMAGKRAALTPMHSANLWLMKDIGHGFKLGGGVAYADDRYAAPDNLVTLDGYVTADAALIYQTKAYDVALNAKNITDKHYFVSGHGASNNLNMPGAPRSVELSARFRF